MNDCVRITLVDDGRPPMEMYSRRGQTGEDNRVEWRDEGGLSTMLQKADKMRDDYGETTTVLQEVERVSMLAEDLPSDSYEIKIEVNKE
tara:strand:+ start:692 stop:958 length:267 start_codon:yes stop_codon:yes gene_type:complete